MSNILQESDVVGVAVAKVYRTPWSTFEGCEICEAFVELANGIVFELENCCDDAWLGPTRLSDRFDSWETSEINGDCEGSKVVDVAISDYWPSIGVVLQNNYILHMDAPHSYLFGPVTSLLGDSRPTDRLHHHSYEPSDFCSVWK